VKLLFDENLSRHLVTRLASTFPDSAHVTVVGLQQATDREVWEYARGHDLAVVSKDSDFNDLAFIHGPPPKVIWLRVANASTESESCSLQPMTSSPPSKRTNRTPCSFSAWRPALPITRPDNDRENRV
jgi:predicted nuclease of predicted toxin-antitoxin system